jgi:hypothetical protein
MTELWPEGGFEEGLADLFEPPVNLEAWAQALRDQGIDARANGPGLAVLHVPDTITSKEEERAWIAAHRPLAGWDGILILVVKDERLA